MRRLLYFSVAIAGILILYAISFISQPAEIELNDLWKYDGEKVIVKGIVKNKIGNVLEISDGKGRCKVYYENNDNIDYGDEIVVLGIVGEYKDEFAVYADEIKICRKWEEENVSLPYLLENYEDFINTNVNVSGYIYSTCKNYFYLTDEFIEYRIKVYYNDSLLFNKFDRVCVKAFFYYDSKNACFLLKIKDEIHGVIKNE